MIFLYITEGHLPEAGAGGCSVAQGACPAEPSKDWSRHQQGSRREEVMWEAEEVTNSSMLNFSWFLKDYYSTEIPW